MDSEIAQLKNEIEELKKQNEQMKKKIVHLAKKNAYTKKSCIGYFDTTAFIVELNIVERHEPHLRPVVIYVKYYCSDESYEEKEDIEGKTYYIIYNDLPSAHVFAKHAWKKLSRHISDFYQGEMLDSTETTMCLPCEYESICPDFLNDELYEIMRGFRIALDQEKRSLGWTYYEDNIRDSDCDEDNISDSDYFEDNEPTDSEEYEDDDITDNDEDDEDDDEDILTNIDECVDECDDEECASIDLTNINRPAC